MELLKYVNLTADKRKCDLFGIGAALQAAANVASTAMTNNTNLRISREANENAYDMFLAGNNFTRDERLDSQAYNTSERLGAQAYNTSEREAAQDYNTQMWLKQAEYNSAGKQAERLLAAGINPAAVLGDAGSAGTVQSSPASVSPGSSSGGSSLGVPGQSVPTMVAPQFSGITDMLDAMSKHEEIKGQRTDNETRDVRNQAEIDKMIAEKEKTLEDTKLSKKERQRLHYEIAGLKIQNARAKFAMEHDQIVEDRTRQLFEKQMRQLDDLNNESMFKIATGQLMNALAIKADSREAARLQSDLNEAKARIKKLGAEKGYIDKQAATEIIRSSIMRTEKRMKDVDYMSKDFDWQRKQRSFDDLIQNGFDEHIDNLIYYMGEAAGVPIKSLIK